MSSYRVYWVNENGKADESFHETRAERDAKLEHLDEQNLEAGWEQTSPVSGQEMELEVQ